MASVPRIPLIITAIILSLVITAGRPVKRIDLNHATRIDLEAIPGIGPAIAGRIVLERNRRGGFRSMNDLLKIRGIGRKTLDHLKRYLFIDDSAQ
ncbi:helix-hairpin-helix domain-containing protein [bacterium]|nr:helix-hairpin-helix domain-containing protein [candidate division CSSED10-310 bacterium]